MIDDVFRKKIVTCGSGWISRISREGGGGGGIIVEIRVRGSWKYKRLQLVRLHPTEDDRGIFEREREKRNGAQSFVEEWRRQTKGRGLNQSLLHLGAPWQNSILSRRLPTLNFDTLRSHQASQHRSKLAFATQGKGMKRRVVNLVIRLPLRRATRRMPRYAQVARLWTNLLLADTYRSTWIPGDPEGGRKGKA